MEESEAQYGFMDQATDSNSFSVEMRYKRC